MLHAITQKKTKLHLRYLGFREDDERRVAAEDEITSLLMSPLSFLPPADVAQFWIKVAKAVNPEWAVKDEVDGVRVEFWPSRSAYSTEKERSISIEPDMVVELLSKGQVCHYFVVEFKWKSKLSGDKQLHDQWLLYLKKEEREKASHLFIAPNISEAKNAKARDDVWKGRLLPITWQNMHQVLTDIKAERENSEIAYWAEQVMETLKMLHIRPFNGFKGLLTSDETKNMASGKEIFSNINHILSVYEECSLLAGMLQEELSNLLNDEQVNSRYSLWEEVGKGWKDSWQEDERGNLYYSQASSLPLLRKPKRRSGSYLFFQISLAGDGMAAVGNHEPLLHIGLWEYGINFREDQYMGFPLFSEEGYGPEAIINNRLMFWNSECGPTWLYTLKLCSVNSLQDILDKVVEPVKALLSWPEEFIKDGIGSVLKDSIEGLAVYTPETGDGSLMGQYCISFQENNRAGTR